MPTTKETIIADVEGLPEGLSIEEALLELYERSLARARLAEARSTNERFTSDQLRQDVKRCLKSLYRNAYLGTPRDSGENYEHHLRSEV